jgi:hypothetical protein
MSTTNSPVTNNAAMAGCLGGMASGRQPVIDAAGEVMEPSDFAAQVTTSETYAAEEQSALGGSFAGSVPTYFSGMGNTGVTATASTGSHTLANAFQTLPVAMMILAMASFDGQPNPSNANGQVTVGYFAAQANAVSSVFANAVVEAGVTGPLFWTD